MNRIPHSEMAEEMSRALRACDQWLLDHGAKRPALEVETKRKRRAALAQAVDDYERAAMRGQEKSA